MYRTQIIHARIAAVAFLVFMVLFGGLYLTALEQGVMPLAGAALASTLIAGVASLICTFHLASLEQRWGRYKRISRGTLRRAH